MHCPQYIPVSPMLEFCQGLTIPHSLPEDESLAPYVNIQAPTL